jgi:hypothetical protein
MLTNLDNFLIKESINNNDIYAAFKLPVESKIVYKVLVDKVQSLAGAVHIARLIKLNWTLEG